MTTARSALAALALAATVALPTSAAAARGPVRAAVPTPAVLLPGDARAAGVQADPATWIVGARPDRPGAAAVARRLGARRVTPTAYLVARGRARALAVALRAGGRLDYAEPNALRHVAQAAPADPLTAVSGWRERVVAGAVPPAAGASSPLIALIDTTIDVSHPDIAGSNIRTAGGAALRDLHGTATATVAAAPTNGVGIEGVWPGARALNLPLRRGEQITCADSARLIASALKARAAVINMSYGGRGDGSGQGCVAELQQIRRAVARGAVPVAAAGNEFGQGNPIEYPASWPHVLTVAASDSDDGSAAFSNENAAVDLAAPGLGILAGVPTAYDTDGTRDGYAVVDGTSFAAPMVAAAVAWVRAARPELVPQQVAQVVRLGARDVGRPGYERATGFGVLSLPGALARPAPAVDPLEPNEDVRLVDGREFGRRAPALGAPVAATLDLAEDPVDVYRVRIRAGRRGRLILRPGAGDPDLYVFDGSARSIAQERRLVGRSLERRGPDRVRVGGGQRTRTLYAVVAFSRRKRLAQLNASYTLTAAVGRR